MKIKTDFKFPSAYQLYIKNGDSRFLKRTRNIIRYYIAKIFTHKEIRLLMQYLQNNTHWIPLFQNNLHNFHALLFKFADRRFNAKQRRSVIQTTLSEMENKIGKEKCQQLLSQKQILLSNLPDNLKLYLQIYEIDPFESFFSLDLKNENNQRLYSIAFVFNKKNRIIITCIQGVKGDMAQQTVRKLTKTLYGIRPMFFLLDALRIFCKTLNCELLGIPASCQVKKRWYGHQHIFFDYDAFWQENDSKMQSGYWFISLEEKRKLLDEIQSKKRSMYRKRYEMLDKLITDMQLIVRK